MSNVKKQGRVPVAKKTEAVSDDLFFDYDVFRIDDAMKKEIEEQGLVFRWINAPKYFKGGNFHRSGWRAYKSKTPSSYDNGINAEGYTIRNDMLLAVKKSEEHERWKAQIRRKTEMRSGAGPSRASDLKSTLSQIGGGNVFEGYEENED